MDPLLAELYERPDDPAAYVVYADALQSRGDPRGELIALQAASVDATAYLSTHPELGPPKVVRDLPFDPATLPGDDIEWFCGFWKALRAFRLYNDDVEALLAHPSAQLLRRLSIRGTNQVTGDVCELAARYLARTLESISVSINSTGIYDDAYQALAPCTRLEAIFLYGDYEDCATLHALHAFPNLHELAMPLTLTDEACAALVGIPVNSSCSAS